MEREAKEKVFENLFTVKDKELSIELLQFFTDIIGMKKDMVRCLDLLDEFSKSNDEQTKKNIRGIILDNFNELPRRTADLMDELVKFLKEE